MRYAGFGDIKQISCSGQTSDIRSNKTVIADQLVNLSTKSFRAERILEEVRIYFDLFTYQCEVIHILKTKLYYKLKVQYLIPMLRN